MISTAHESWAEQVFLPLTAVLLPNLTLAAALASVLTDRDLMGFWLIKLTVPAYLLSILIIVLLDRGSGSAFAGVLLLFLMLAVSAPFGLGVGAVLAQAHRHFDPAQRALPATFVGPFLGEPFPLLDQRPHLRTRIADTCATGGGLVNGFQVQFHAGVVLPPPAPGGLSLSRAGNDAPDPQPPHPAALFVQTDRNTTVLLRPRSHQWTLPQSRPDAAFVPGDRIAACGVPGLDADWWPRIGIADGDAVYSEPIATYAQTFWLLDLPRAASP